MNIPLNIDWQQIVLHLMNFAILAGGLYFLLYNPVKKFMAKRAEYYENMDKEANEKLESATIKEAEYQKHMEELEAELDAKHTPEFYDALVLRGAILREESYCQWLKECIDSLES